MSNSNFYQVGGALSADSPSYIKRKADDQFYAALKNKQFCYVLNSRQMGKSSLWYYTQARLTADGVQCVYIDLTKVGKSSSEEGWYRVLLYELVKTFNLSIGDRQQAKVWWEERADVSPIKRFDEFMEEVLLEEIKKPIIICFDEIDYVLSFNFVIDPFFAWIRACHNQRANNPIYLRLTFCILGVATVSNFIRDKTRTPFNIAQNISLTGFNKNEAQPLIQGLKGKVSNPQQILEDIIDETGGQPFLTQKIFQLISESRSGLLGENPKAKIDVRDFVFKKIIDNWEYQDNPQHLRTIRDRLLCTPSSGRRMLKLYQEILARGEIPSNSDSEQIQLRLTGLVIENNGYLKPYNRIYRNVFNENWVKQELDKIFPFIEQYETWLAEGEDSSKLLSGQELQEALEWCKNKSINESLTRFLELSVNQEKQRNKAQSQRTTYELAENILASEFEEDQRNNLIREIFLWTGNQLQLIEIVCQLLIEQKNSLQQREYSIEELISINIIENWQNIDHLREMGSHLLNKDGYAKSRLEKYKQILQDRVSADERPETLALLQVELIINNDGWLEVSNRIYREVFNLRWVKEELENIAQKENQTAPLTRTLSLYFLLGFIIGGIFLFFLNKPETVPSNDSNSPNSNDNNIVTESPEICRTSDLSVPLETRIQKLKNLQNENPEEFSSECETQLTELNWIQKAIGLAQNNIVASKRVENAFETLCQIPENSLNFNEAQHWVNEWYGNNYWKPRIDEALENNPECRKLIE
ncbi:MAG: AAA-like domain-containing protein [Gomphosphaeria aponina SAG 52.96 = DSM 107014]|uniref:AAA-like domain-containing protein n=1 Tax=Gomphosphaeria aponina SAG 52.96 = DSM 107014 TaxID=1521640 RepID=A0A941GWS6_9CHRO|nr:AAA-like domain-containing protein [Gomphosphaeria aponina SAG 52.96 = DSM 107014]